jgi:hypothetical protein
MDVSPVRQERTTVFGCEQMSAAKVPLPQKFNRKRMQ